MNQELDFYYSKQQENIQRSLYRKIHSFKGRIYTECCDKGFYKNKKNNFDDSIYLGSGFYSDITF